MIDVVEEPVDGRVPAEKVVPVGLPPVVAPAPPTTGVDAATTTKVTVRWALAVPVIVTVKLPGLVGALVKLPVAVAVVSCAGIRSPCTLPVSNVDALWHGAVTEAGVDWGWAKVIVSPT